jgi:acyl-CoA thioesterase I
MRRRGRTTGRPHRGKRMGTLLALLALCMAAVSGCMQAARAASRRTLDATPTVTATPTPSSAAPLTYVAIGASDAFGIGTDHPDNDAWPTVVARRLGANTHLINLGIPGATVELASRDEAPIAVATGADIITVWLGINDYDDGVRLQDFTQRLSGLLKRLAAGTKARIYVGNLPDLTLLPYFGKRSRGELTAAVQQWNQAIAQVCRDAGATVVDLFADWSEQAQHPEYVSADGLHPSTLGAGRISDLFVAAIEGKTP